MYSSHQKVFPKAEMLRNVQTPELENALLDCAKKYYTQRLMAG